MKKNISTINVPSEISSIRKVSSEILKGLSSLRIDEDRLFDIRLCAEESVHNAIVHGNKLDKKLYVRVDYWTEKDRLIIEVEDQGPGFEPSRTPDPTDDDNIMKNSGRGVYLIRKLMDNVDFNEKGNKVRMEKKLK